MTRQERKLKSIQNKSMKFGESIKLKIWELCELSKYQDSSRLSYNIDRLNAFLQELNGFEFQNK